MNMGRMTRVHHHINVGNTELFASPQGGSNGQAGKDTQEHEIAQGE
jgi:hypothetical protein